ncbi:putative aldolase class 2 protein PA3430 isoform X2 [Liolophura sinensis]|uniref:putative aldolase class 2 protein PA3430 isoform X2 n=1 Tax=Liolophura sinensis TaxID=3198878 RepID=UPI0031582DEE
MSSVEENREGRVALAVAFRTLEKLGLHEGVDNHLSLMVPAARGVGQVMLINPYGLHWSEITASSLVGVNKEGKVVEGEGQPDKAATAVHLGLRQVRPDTPCIMHTHMPYATALGMLEDPRIKLYHQNASRLYGIVAYDADYQGIPSATEEGRRLGELLGDNEVMIMQNHGALTIGNTVAMAFDLMYSLERACMFQILAYSTGRPLREFPESVAKQRRENFPPELDSFYADIHFKAMKRKVIRETPDVLK